MQRYFSSRMEMHCSKMTLISIISNFWSKSPIFRVIFKQRVYEYPWICTAYPFPLIFFVSSQLFWDNVGALRIQFLHSRRYRLFDKSLWIYAKTQWTLAGLNVAASTFPNQTFCSKSQLITFRVPYQTESIDSDDTVCSNIM